MLACGNCGHGLVFHRALPEEEPCYLCPRGPCSVGGCACNKYSGIGLTRTPHKYHLASKVGWGAWGMVQFQPAPDLEGGKATPDTGEGIDAVIMKLSPETKEDAASGGGAESR